MAYNFTPPGAQPYQALLPGDPAEVIPGAGQALMPGAELQAPAPYSPIYSEADMADPRRQLWAGTLTDMGNWLMRGGQGGMQGLGLQMYNQARQGNQRMQAANRQEQHRVQQAQNQYAAQQQQMAANRQALASGALKLEHEQGLAEQGLYGAGQDLQSWVAAGGTPEEWIKNKQRAVALASQAPADVRSTQLLMKQSPEVQAMHFANKRGAQLEEISPGVFRYWDPATRTLKTIDGKGEPVDLNRDIEVAEAQHSGVVSGTQKSTGENIEEQARIDREFVQGYDEQVPQAQSTIASSRDLIEQIKSGEYSKTGRLIGYWSQYNDREAARLAAQATYQTLQSLQITNLGQITEKELELVGKMYADVMRSPAANIGALEGMINLMQSKLDGMNRKRAYMDGPGGGSLAGYGAWSRDQAKAAEAAAAAPPQPAPAPQEQFGPNNPMPPLVDYDLLDELERELEEL